jgi:L-cysteine/cystine lyase
VPPDLSSVRAELPCLADETYLNTGGAGPFPAVAAAAVGGAIAGNLARGRLGIATAQEADERQIRLRAELGALLGAGPEDVAITGNTTVGLDVVVWGIDWRPGDEIITTALEHPGLSVPLRVVARRMGATLHLIPADEAHGDLEAAVARRAGPRTRLVALSHVAWGTGARLDVAGAARAARAAGALSAIDGAQSVGAIPVDPAALGVDAYAFPAHKWLLGPEGLGGLWVAPGARERIDLSFAGYDSGQDHRPDGTLTLHAGARRYEISTPPAPLLPGWSATLEWLEGLGWDWIFERVRAGQAAARARLEQVPGVRVLTPPGDHAGLVTFTLDGVDAEAACRALHERGVIIRWLTEPAAMRASIGFYTDSADIERLALEVASLSG